MYPILLNLHSWWRWLVLGSLICSIYISYNGKAKMHSFTASANKWRHWTASIAHVQLLLGMAIYVQSPIVMFKLLDNPNKWINEQTFFRYFHIGLMLLAIALITIGSAKAKRIEDDQKKFSTMLNWFALALFVIFMAIPWPFSPLASRPYWRAF